MRQPFRASGGMLASGARLVADPGPAQLLERLDARHEARAEARERRGPERGRLLLVRDLDGPSEDVCLELHEQAVRGRAAVGPQHVELEGHRVDHVGDLERDRLERRACDVLARRAAA